MIDQSVENEVNKSSSHWVEDNQIVTSSVPSIKDNVHYS